MERPGAAEMIESKGNSGGAVLQEILLDSDVWCWVFTNSQSMVTSLEWIGNKEGIDGKILNLVEKDYRATFKNF
ncbi:hypothetical protein AVEN_101222-1 [Araneus ventricosus]|uniref:Uncharacterized protein n=1 Tax=Araneus ventricosus TaxID=182803 RepID=A0A4Y2FY01_ARAVE|nr:hypothetical protein AVEN_101222-1 [Araneus ventricosus]